MSGAAAVRGMALYASVLVVLFPAVFVFFWMITSALKQPVDIFAMPPRWLDFTVTFDNFRKAIADTPLLRYGYNSFVVAMASSLTGLVLGLPAAYSIARFQQHRLGLVLLTARLMPGVAYLVPFFVLFVTLRLVGTHWALILSHLVVTFPLTVYLMIGFFEDLPHELYDSAEIDGCGPFDVFWRIALPLSMPGVITASVLAFIFSWNDFKMALILSDSDTRTLPVAVYSFI